MVIIFGKEHIHEHMSIHLRYILRLIVVDL
jgi:hypothetical protein